MGEELLWESEDGTFLRVLVRPNSGQRELIHTLSDTELIVNLRSPAREGKANTELVKKIAKALSLSSSDVVLVGGHKSKEKILKIVGLSASEVLSALETLHKP